jgi:hypothetical protein
MGIISKVLKKLCFFCEFDDDENYYPHAVYGGNLPTSAYSTSGGVHYKQTASGPMTSSAYVQPATALDRSIGLRQHSSNLSTWSSVDQSTWSNRSTKPTKNFFSNTPTELEDIYRGQGSSISSIHPSSHGSISSGTSSFGHKTMSTADYSSFFAGRDIDPRSLEINLSPHVTSRNGYNYDQLLGGKMDYYDHGQSRINPHSTASSSLYVKMPGSRANIREMSWGDDTFTT